MRCTECKKQLCGAEKFCVYCGQIQPKKPYGGLITSVVGLIMLLVIFSLAGK